jgi:hypothetical protein
MIFNVFRVIFQFYLQSLLFDEATNLVNYMLDLRVERTHPLGPVSCEFEECGGHMKLADTLKVICDIYKKYPGEHTSGEQMRMVRESSGGHCCS